MNKKAYSNAIYNSQEVETMQIFINIGKKINKLWYIHTMGYYTVMRTIYNCIQQYE